MGLSMDQVRTRAAPVAGRLPRGEPLTGSRRIVSRSLPTRPSSHRRAPPTVRACEVLALDGRSVRRGRGGDLA
jgi:hypothetical protein